MRVALLQLEASGELADRRRRASSAIRQAADDGADLIVLPELWSVGAFEAGAWRERAESVDGPTADWAAEAARDAGVVLHAGSIIERGDQPPPHGSPALYNTSLVFGPDGRRLATYRKIHRFGAGGPERELLEAGEQVVVVPLPLPPDAPGTTRAGLATCYDLRFPELFRAQSSDTDTGRAQVLLLVASWRRDAASAWRLLTRARAVENQAVVIACGAAGVSGRQALAGGSIVVDARGQVLAEARTDPQTLLVDVDLSSVDTIRREFPVGADRRLY
ncbi:MAG: apolipoprotein acyltransferase [Austwickia sp.]|jgi:predicted amidohydrolase|nr:apolipoprotein acyltransferase [Austwickia sp.]